VSRTIVSDIEHGRASRTSIAVVRQATAPLELSVELTARGRGADVDRVLDERHARLLGTTARWLVGLGWATMAEVSYSEWGERGSIDLLAWHEPTATLLVIEVKTELVSVEATLRKHDEKVRLAPRIARDRLGWAVRTTGPPHRVSRRSDRARPDRCPGSRARAGLSRSRVRRPALVPTAERPVLRLAVPQG
jgi:hypothetical protein